MSLFRALWNKQFLLNLHLLQLVAIGIVSLLKLHNIIRLNYSTV